MNLQETIRRILREETKPPLYFRRRASDSDIERLVRDVKISISGGKNKSDALYDAVQNFISSNKEHFKDYMWSINHLPSLIKYINSKLDEEPLNESILMEENDGHKLKLVIRMIYSLYDEVSFIEQSTYNNKPLLKIYFNSDDTATNIESWFDEKISRDIDEYTSGNIVVCPSWMFEWDWRKKNADVFIETELLKYDNLGNVINESELRDETQIPLPIKRRLSNSDIEEAFLKALDLVYYAHLENQSSSIKNMSLNTFAKLVIDEMTMFLEQDYFSDENRIYFDDGETYHDEIRVPLMNYFGDRIKRMYDAVNEKVVCQECGWSWDLSDGGDDPYTCHKCGHENI